MGDHECSITDPRYNFSMRFLGTGLLLILSAGPVLSQLDSNSVTVTASRSATSPMDQVILAVYVDSNLTKSLSDIVNAVSGVGITPANFSSLSQSSNPTLPLEWGFTLTVPLASLGAMATALAALQQSIAANNPGVTLGSFSVVNSQSSQTAPCPIPGLLSDASAQAQTLASGVGRSLGGILAMSASTSAGGAISPCSLTVKFALGN